MLSCDICIDVDDVAAAVRFYGKGIGLELVKQESDWAQLKVSEQTIWIMKAAPGPSGPINRSYHRHWTPVHLDFHVDDIDKVIARAIAAGGKLESRPKPELANLSDPAGNGVDLVKSS